VSLTSDESFAPKNRRRRSILSIGRDQRDRAIAGIPEAVEGALNIAADNLSEAELCAAVRTPIPHCHHFLVVVPPEDEIVSQPAEAAGL
jgi:hypothetical protein